jgi:hypothetical protein
MHDYPQTAPPPEDWYWSGWKTQDGIEYGIAEIEGYVWEHHRTKKGYAGAHDHLIVSPDPRPHDLRVQFEESREGGLICKCWFGDDLYFRMLHFLPHDDIHELRRAARSREKISMQLQIAEVLFNNPAVAAVGKFQGWNAGRQCPVVSDFLID